MKVWPEAAERICDLDTKVQRREVGAYIVQWNPARAVSTLAKVDKATLAKRPCFLCRENRPAVQEALGILGGRWEVLINPFPILHRHLTIVSAEHTPQRLTRQDFEDMLEISRALPDFVVFYNGARCGASAPDHKHLQAGLASALPPFPTQTADALWLDIKALPVPAGRDEADFNLLVLNGRGRLIPRSRHRPACYREGTCLVSPGALDMAGLVITPREEDFRSLTAPQIAGILAECGTPEISVGIMEAPRIAYDTTPEGFTLHGVTIGKQFHWQRTQDQTFTGRLRIVRNPESGLDVAINDVDVENYLLSVISSEMSGTSSLALLKAHAVISRSWAMRRIAEASLPCVPKEEKTCAGQGCGSLGQGSAPLGQDNTSLGQDSAPAFGDELGHVRIYDTEAHRLFHVCADDHCQRYQGVGGVNAVVEQAVRETRGEVLCAQSGELCDTRFSKCCGGRTELFSTCWQDRDYDYLQSVRCPYCQTRDARLLRQVLNGYDLETADFHTWQVRYTQQELSDLVESRLHLHLGLITDLVPLRRGPSGRISHLRVVGEERSAVVGKELEIRRMLNPTHLLSSNFQVRREGSGFVLDGHGWGHGVGLCQIGAAVMAAEGCDYRGILSHYYPSSQIKANYGKS